MSCVGTIFEIREFSLFDGPGVRTTVFLKGCPLRCLWCHNPEGIAPQPQLLFSQKNCTGCGTCRTVCPRTDDSEPCRHCGRCAAVCPAGARRFCGKTITAASLAEELIAQSDFFRSPDEGGVTFSGGEPLFQAPFVIETAQRLREAGISVCIETSGFASANVYRRVVGLTDLLFQDLKHPDDAEHRRVTGVSNRPILDNIRWLCGSGKRFILRIPVIPTVNDSLALFEQTAELLAEYRTSATALERVELLPYHAAAGGKYEQLGQHSPVLFPEKPIYPKALAPFTRRGIEARIL